MTNPTYRKLLKELGLTDTDIAKMFGYATAAAWRNSSAKERIEKGITELVARVRGIK